MCITAPPKKRRLPLGRSQRLNGRSYTHPESTGNEENEEIITKEDTNRRKASHITTKTRTVRITGSTRRKPIKKADVTSRRERFKLHSSLLWTD